MRFRLKFVVGFALSLLIAAPDLPGNSFRQSPASGAASKSKSSQMLDREQNDLRGLVKTCVEESTYPHVPGSNGTEILERKGLYSTDYDSEGRIVQTTIRNPDSSEWQTRYQYDPSGHLLKTLSGKQG